MSMVAPRAREKLLHAIAFFVANTKACQKTKLFKLLYMLDFGIYRQTGKSVTGLQYFAWKFGPVPQALFGELKSPAPDMKAMFLLRESDLADPDERNIGLSITPRKKCDETRFTRRELAWMKHLAEVFRDAPAKDMVLVSHLPGEPWHQIFEVEHREKAHIPYVMALNSNSDPKAGVTVEQAKLIEDEAREAAAILE